jgi:hypothetical protein
MDALNGTGIIYPKIELDGKKYELKVSRGALLYDLSRNGVSIGEIHRGDFKSYAAVMDVLHAIIADQLAPGVFPTARSLAVYIQEEGTDKVKEVAAAVREAVGKAFPPVTPPAQAEVKTPAVQ